MGRREIELSGSIYNPFQYRIVNVDSATGVYRMTQRFYHLVNEHFTQQV